MDRIKIAYLTKSMQMNGISMVIMNYCKNLDNSKFKITIFTGTPVDSAYIDECEKCDIALKILPQKRKNIVKYYIKLFKEINKKNIDIIHIHGNSAKIVGEVFIAFIKGIKSRIAHCHNTTCDRKIVHKILKPLLNKVCTQRYACSNEAGEWMFGKHDFEIIPNGFDVSSFKYNPQKREEIRKKLNIDNKFVIGHIGRFNNQKNHPYLLQIFEEVATKDEGAILLLVGNGPNLDSVKELISNHPYKDRIIYYGETKNVSEIYDALDVFVLPSKHEGLGIVLLEAQIKGLYCVSSNVVPKEVALCNNICFLELGNNVKLWADEILKTHNIKRETFFEENYNRIKNYDIKENAKLLMQKYERMCE